MAKKSSGKSPLPSKSDLSIEPESAFDLFEEESYFDFSDETESETAPETELVADESSEAESLASSSSTDSAHTESATPEDEKASDKYVDHAEAKPSSYVSSSATTEASTTESTPEVVYGSGSDDVIETSAADHYVKSGHGDDSISSKGGDDFIKAGKGNDSVISSDGNDVLDGGHGDDLLDGGAGNDILNGDKGNDSLIYTLSENTGATDFYDGGKGSDSLVLRLSKSEYAEYEAELNQLEEWIADNSNPIRSTSKQFNDASHNSAQHPVFETSFGLTLRNFESLEIEITDPETPEVELPPVESEIEATITGEGPIPLKNVDVSLVEGSQITFDVEVSVEELPAKYDVFMLHDLSGSFWNDLPNVQAQFSGLYDSLTADADVAFGVGSFVDKPMETFGSSFDYVYNTDLSVTSDKETIQTTLDNLHTSSGWDWPESQMEALVQTALREDEIGFRDGAQKFAVLFTDAPYHKEGDYETTSVYDSETGTMTSVAVADNDYDTEFEVEDYPDPAVVGRMLIDAGVTPVFAVTAPYIDMYQQLVDEWGVGIVTELTSDSSNIADAITNGITEAPLNLELEALGDDYGFVSSVEPPIYENAEPGSYNFTVTMEIPEESESYSSDSITLEVTGYGEVNVNVEIDQIDITGDSTNDILTGDAGPNAIYGMEGDDTLIGTGGSDQLFGGSGHDTLTGGLADDELTGGAGDDVFVFASGDGSDTVTDFSEGDLLDLRRVSSIENFADVEAAATQVEADTVLDFGNGDSITLLGVNAETLSEDSLII
ncbi:hypothetical protein ACMXYO_15880 [Neptuniibacter sp. QD37_6]|uniref:hypothetical protein n=1 Tax=Neptuniibacter sp. QD37_6 TaxID=3398210 RepID=UPI0039F52883